MFSENNKSVLFKGAGTNWLRKVYLTTVTMFCTIMLFDWEIIFNVYSRKNWLVTCTFQILFIIYIEMQVIVGNFTKMELFLTFK